MGSEGGVLLTVKGLTNWDLFLHAAPAISLLLSHLPQPRELLLVASNVSFKVAGLPVAIVGTASDHRMHFGLRISLRLLGVRMGMVVGEGDNGLRIGMELESLRVGWLLRGLLWMAVHVHPHPLAPLLPFPLGLAADTQEHCSDPDSNQESETKAVVVSPLSVVAVLMSELFHLFI